MPYPRHGRLPPPSEEAKLMDTLAGVKRGKKKTERDKEDDQAVARTIRMLEMEARMRRNPNRTVLQKEIGRRIATPEMPGQQGVGGQY